MTADDWKKVEAALQSPYGRAKLEVDGYALDLVVQQTKPLKFEIGFFVDGWFKGAWLMADSEERRRFCCPKQLSLYSPAKKAKLLKGLTKRAIAEYFPSIDKKHTYYSSHWSRFAPLKRHLIANNKSIELKECSPCN
ncbi:hypothetical protein [Polaromonas sp. JS666]|uniref:hypothetical protein n=1 Tax=Polaromonas sp. (strain JS666 / ATCC BAA-500) TaxID=296591 RepID=UPI0000464B44|nr:hypothetical protein [Polaromonas sp. JS666]ABE45668.1 hypothetical protein Bpro_3769 [Polaromonas sp. JS666]